MRYVQSTPPVANPISLPEVRRHVNAAGTDDDVYLEALIAKATRLLERQLSRQFVTATWKLYLDEFPDEILLERLPVGSVTSIEYVDLAGDTQTLDEDEYQTDLVCQDTPGRIQPAYGLSWPTTREDTLNAVTVTFTAGYGGPTAVPPTIKHAIALLVAHWYENREAVSDVTLASVPAGFDAIIASEDWGSYA